MMRNVSHRAWRVWQRDLDVYRTTWKLNFLPPLLEPVLYILAFGLGMGQLIGTISYFGEEIDYLRFMVPGVVAVAIMFWSYFETTYATFVRMVYQRTFEAIITTPLLVEDVIGGIDALGRECVRVGVVAVRFARDSARHPGRAHLLRARSHDHGSLADDRGIQSSDLLGDLSDVPFQRDVLPVGHPSALGERDRLDPAADPRLASGAWCVLGYDAAICLGERLVSCPSDADLGRGLVSPDEAAFGEVRRRRPRLDQPAGLRKKIESPSDTWCSV
jgi:hypothetical protein